MKSSGNALRRLYNKTTDTQPKNSHSINLIVNKTATFSPSDCRLGSHILPSVTLYYLNGIKNCTTMNMLK